MLYVQQSGLTSRFEQPNEVGKVLNFFFAASRQQNKELVFLLLHLLKITTEPLSTRSLLNKNGMCRFTSCLLYSSIVEHTLVLCLEFTSEIRVHRIDYIQYCSPLYAIPPRDLGGSAGIRSKKSFLFNYSTLNGIQWRGIWSKLFSLAQIAKEYRNSGTSKIIVWILIIQTCCFLRKNFPREERK